MVAPHTRINRRYRIEQVIGQGGTGTVYRATDLRFGRTVAIKQLPTGALGQHAFEREARLLANLRHQALPAVSDYLLDPAGLLIVMDYIEGADLAMLLSTSTLPLPLATSLHWADQACDVVAYLHSQQPPLLHNDIKPANIKINRRGQLILLDFGLAKGGAVTQAVHSISHAGGYTPQYAALEQMQNLPTDERTDIYALGATLYHIFTGQPPQGALVRAAMLLDGDPDPLVLPQTLNPALPDALNTALLQALALYPADRLVQIEQLRAAVRQAQQTHPYDSAAAAQITSPLLLQSAQPQAPSTPRRRGVPYQEQLTKMGFLLGVIVLLGSCAAWMRKQDTPQLGMTKDVTVISAADQPAGSAQPIVALAATPAPLTAVRLKDSVPIYDMALSPDGQTVALAVDNLVKLRAVYAPDSRPKLDLAGHTAQVDALAWSPDGAVLASGGWDHMVRLWSADGYPIAELQGHSHSVTALAWSPDGTVLASASLDFTVRLWRTDGSLIATLEHPERIFSVAWSADGSTIYAICGDHTMYSWSANGQPVGFPVALTTDGDVIALAVAPSDAPFARTTVFATTTGVVDRLGAQDTLLHAYAGYSSVRAEWGDNGESSWGIYTVYVEQGAEQPTSQTHHVGTMHMIAWSPDGSKLAAVGLDHKVWVWGHDGSKQATFTGHTANVSALVWASNAQLGCAIVRQVSRWARSCG